MECGWEKFLVCILWFDIQFWFKMCDPFLYLADFFIFWTQPLSNILLMHCYALSNPPYSFSSINQSVGLSHFDPKGSYRLNTLINYIYTNCEFRFVCNFLKRINVNKLKKITQDNLISPWKHLEHKTTFLAN